MYTILNSVVRCHIIIVVNTETVVCFSLQKYRVISTSFIRVYSKYQWW